EQIEGRAVDGRTDQYALACAAFEMLSGEAPFLRDQELAVIWAHLSQPPPSLTARRPDLPAAVNQVFDRALAKSPGDRYASCRGFADALREALGLDPYLAGHGGAAAIRPARDNAWPGAPAGQPDGPRWQPTPPAGGIPQPPGRSAGHPGLAAPRARGAAGSADRAARRRRRKPRSADLAARRRRGTARSADLATRPAGRAARSAALATRPAGR